VKVFFQSVNLEAREREFLVLAGEGGSALLRSLAGLEDSAGELRVGNRVVNGLPPTERGVAMVLPHAGLFPQWSGVKNIAFGLKGRPSSKVEAAAEVTGAADALALRPAAMTAVQRLRVALARAVVGQPKAVLCDNPLAALDVDDRAKMRAELVRLQERLQTTFLYATRDPLEAMMGHRVAVFDAGKLRGVDVPQMLYDRPPNRFVAGFLGRPQMNFLAGRVAAGVFKETGGTVQVAATANDGEVTLGFRPEAATAEGRCQGLVEHAESTGADVFYTVQTGGHLVIIRGAPGIGVGRRMAFDIVPEKVHLFEKESGERI